MSRTDAPTSSRATALAALVRIEVDGAFANLVLPAVLDRSGLDDRDRAHVTELVYGTTRMRRACDWSVDRFLSRRVEPEVRCALRLGAYQLLTGTPAHAAVGETVGVAPARARSLVNAVLRRVADQPPEWPSDAVRLSYPDWVVDRLIADLGRDDALAALEEMDRPASATVRPDGYVQDRASQLVVEAMGVGRGDLAVDVCAAPGGKATALAESGARVVALDRRPGRAGLVVANRSRLGLAPDRLAVAIADGLAPPMRPGVAGAVLVDAPCTGLGALRRRPDARWRIGPEAVDRLASIQVHLLRAAADLVAPGGTLTYSVCTLTRAETTAAADRLSTERQDLEPLAVPGAPWRADPGGGALLLPQAEGTDGMFLFRWRRSPSASLG